MQIFHTYAQLLSHINQTARSSRTLGHTPDGSPLICVRTGGDKTPAIFITAGSHATEQAGVSVAIDLIQTLDTEHQVYIYPTRDPIGLNGFAYALSLGLGEAPAFDTYDQVESLLRENGDIIYDEDGMVLALIGDCGYASCSPTENRPHAQWAFHQTFVKLSQTRPELVEPLKGRRLYITPGQPGVEGTGHFGRAYTLIIAPDGEVLHLNRFHDTSWSPIEARCARKLLAEIKPGISFDIHESQLMEDRFWLSARHQQNHENEIWQQRIATEIIAAIVASGAELASDKDVTGGVALEETWFRKSEPGVYWLDASIRGEGFNLSDYISRHYGLVFGTEMGMYGSFEKRFNLGKLTVQTAVRIFEKRYS